MRTQHFIYCLAVIAVLFTACKKDEKTPQVKKDVFSGYAQKGPFMTGASVTIMELDTTLNQTGKTYFTTISDNLGSFEQKNIELVSNYVELKADGYYFHEAFGGIIASTITLYALADIADVNSANVNVLTTLEKQRVEYLVKQGMSFSDAKKQAQSEILAIFGFNSLQIPSEALNLTNDAILIATSCIVQGCMGSPGQIMELMTNISAEIRTDGVLNNNALGKKLIDNAIMLTTYSDVGGFPSTWLFKIRYHLEKRYAELGIDVTIPDFESYIQAFAESNLYP